MSAKNSEMTQEEVAAVERFIVDTQFRLHQLLESNEMSRADLARALGVSRSRVSQFFGDHPNLTLETLARIFFAVKESPALTSPRIEHRIALLDAASRGLPKGEWVALSRADHRAPRFARPSAEAIMDILRAQCLSTKAYECGNDNEALAGAARAAVAA